MQSVAPIFASGVVYSGADWTFTPNNAAPTGNPITGSHGSPRLSTETRPKNVALMICMRKDT